MTQIILKEDVTAISLYEEDGYQAVLDTVQKMADEFVPDLSSPAKRKEIASFAYKIAQTKVKMDDLGKEHNADLKKKTKEIDDKRKKVRDTLESLQKQVRDPLTVWEENQAKTAELYESAMDQIKGFSRVTGDDGQNYNSKTLKEKLAKCEAFEIDPLLEESKAKIQKLLDMAKNVLNKNIAKREEEEAQAKKDAEELEKLRKEKEEREAAEKKKLEAEEKAKEQARIEAEAKKKADAEAAKKVEEAKKAQAEAEQKAAAAEKKKAAEIEAAKESERKKIEAEKQKKAQEEKEREENLAHRKKINNDILIFLEENESSFTNDDAGRKNLITAIAKGEMPHVKIQY